MDLHAVGGQAGDPAVWHKPQRGQVHSGTFSLNTYTSSSARVGLHPLPRTLSPSESPAPRCNRRLHLLWLPWGRRPVRCLRFINKFRGGRRGRKISAMQREVWVAIMVLMSAVKAAVGERGAEGAMRADGLEVQ